MMSIGGDLFVTKETTETDFYYTLVTEDGEGVLSLSRNQIKNICEYIHDDTQSNIEHLSANS